MTTNNTEGAVTGLREAGKTVEDVKVVGYDASAPILEALEDGDVTGLVVQYPYGAGVLGVDTAVRSRQRRETWNATKRRRSCSPRPTTSNTRRSPAVHLQAGLRLMADGASRRDPGASERLQRAAVVEDGAGDGIERRRPPRRGRRPSATPASSVKRVMPKDFVDRLRDRQRVDEAGRRRAAPRRQSMRGLRGRRTSTSSTTSSGSRTGSGKTRTSATSTTPTRRRAGCSTTAARGTASSRWSPERSSGSTPSPTCGTTPTR